ncbi:hypothetical protein KHS38_11725 [Mucilaginibacter sp. Bleaf8]|uniref:hypothetical protein n=1 Tax=Mucilaginibacter sp. Bleaf8 TaxID=2834430 RepID=UPI001BD117AD|nr:hypothetical protein [Mucilaginibacter sp. Bleaf8]MBS7565074.1 hypothetical protein [Mucilaginibacter sp. Bleaf8]
MAIRLISTPKEISFSRNPNIFRFKSDAQRSYNGAVCLAYLYLNITDDQDIPFTLTYGNQKLPMRVTTVPDDSGYQITKISGNENHDALIIQAAKDLNANFYLNRDFDITTDTVGGGTRYVKFTAKSPGTAFNLQSDRSDYNCYVYTMQSGADEVLNKNFRLYYELWVENATGSGYDKKSEAYLEPGITGEAAIDLSLHLTGALLADGYDRPSLKNAIAKRDILSLRKYYLQYAEVYGDTQVIRKLNKTETFYSLLGGISNELLEEFAFPESFTSQGKLRFLKQEPQEKYIRPEQPEFLSVVTFSQGYAQLQLATKMYFTDDSTLNLPGAAFPAVPKYTKLTFPVGYAQNNLNLVAGDKQLYKYEVYLVDEQGATVSEIKTYWLDGDYKPYTRYYLYLSSWGTYDTQITYGKASAAYELVKQQANVTRVGAFQLMNGEQVDYSNSLTNTETITTGYRTKRDIRQFKDLFLSRDKFLIRKGRAYPVTLASKEISEFKDGDDLTALTFEMGFLFKEQMYTFDDKDDAPAALYFPIIVGGGPPADDEPADKYDSRYYRKTETYNITQVDDFIALINSQLSAMSIQEREDIQEVILQLKQKADVNHNHDDRYMPIAEMQDLLIQLQQAIDTGGVLAEDITFDIQVGAVTQGATLAKGTNFTQAMKAFAYKVYYPILNLPKFSLSHQEPAQIEVGTVLTVDLVFNFDRGKIQATWPGGVDMPIVGEATGYRFWNADESGFQIVGGTNYQKQNYMVLPGANSFKADVIYNAGPQPKDSKGNNFGGAMQAGISDKVSASFTGLYKHFWSAVGANPATAAEGRLGNSAWSTANTFTVATGITLTRWAVIIAPGKKVAKVMDTTTNNDITTEYQLLDSNFSVNDAGGSPVFGFKLYVKSQSGTYDSSHDHVFTLTNN